MLTWVVAGNKCALFHGSGMMTWVIAGNKCQLFHGLRMLTWVSAVKQVRSVSRVKNVDMGYRRETSTQCFAG
jgi:hypothetical protein